MYYCFIKVIRRLLPFVFALIWCNIADAQSLIDSLTSLAKNKKGSERVDLLIQLAKAQVSVDVNSSLNSISDAYELALQTNDSSRIVLTGMIKGEFLRRTEKIKESIDLLNKIIPVAKRNKLQNNLKFILNSLALDYTFQANYDKALEYHFQSLIIRESDNDKPAISITLNNIGLVYFKLGDFEKAIEYYKRSLLLKKEINDSYDLDRLLINIGLSYNHLKDFKNARRFIQDGLKACGSDCSQQIKIEGQIGFGISYFEEHNYNEAKNHFVESYNIAKTEGNKRFQLENLLYLARIYIDEEDHSKAQSYLTQAESIASETEYNQLFIDIYREFSRLYNQTKDFERATYYQGRYIHLKDSIYSADLIKNLASVQTNFEERENKAIIAVNEETISRQRKLNFAIGVIAVLSLLLIWVLYHSNKVKKKVNNALSEAKNFIELKNKELDKKVAEKTADLEVANESLRKVNDELDNFIYKTSHDIRGPLASLKGICNVALLDVHDPVALSYLDKLDVTAEHLNTILTRLLIINQINNSAIKTDAVNFESVVEEVLLLEHKKGLPPRLVIKKTIDPELEFYCDKEFIRIILENLIDNAIKFFNDSDRIDPFVDIRIEKDGNDIKIRVIDNGIGISEAKPDKIFQMFSRASERSSTGGIGLYITKTATEKIGGHIGLRTTPEGYTEFYVKFPIKRSWFSEHLTND